MCVLTTCTALVWLARAVHSVSFATCIPNPQSAGLPSYHQKGALSALLIKFLAHYASSMRRHSQSSLVRSVRGSSNWWTAPLFHSRRIQSICKRASRCCPPPSRHWPLILRRLSSNFMLEFSTRTMSTPQPRHSTQPWHEVWLSSAQHHETITRIPSYR